LPESRNRSEKIAAPLGVNGEIRHRGLEESVGGFRDGPQARGPGSWARPVGVTRTRSFGPSKALAQRQVLHLARERSRAEVARFVGVRVGREGARLKKERAHAAAWDGAGRSQGVREIELAVLRPELLLSS